MGLLDPATSDGRVIFFLPWESEINSLSSLSLSLYSSLDQISPHLSPPPSLGLSLSPYLSPPSLSDRTVAGTTDSPTELTHLPMPREEDIKFILSEIKAYLSPNLSGKSHINYY